MKECGKMELNKEEALKKKTNGEVTYEFWKHGK